MLYDFDYSVSTQEDCTVHISLSVTTLAAFLCCFYLQASSFDFFQIAIGNTWT